jgi:5-methylcytosine-specific restriction enzyme subunit McrC
MLAYCTALQLERGWLVYAQGGSAGIRHIRNTSIEIIQYPLDLAASPVALLRQVAALASKALASIRGPKGDELLLAGAYDFAQAVNEAER